MAIIFAQHALVGDRWMQDVRLHLEGARIARIDPGAPAQAGDIHVDTLLPALGNLHSHSFQRAMAGRTEIRQAARDSFWTWRDLMYRFVQALTPEQYQAIAALVFMEMQEAGFAAVGEFHYVHHQVGGAPYATLSELSQRVFAAAAETGIGLTHLPVLYSYGGAGEAPLGSGQSRFGNDLTRFAHLLEEARLAAKSALPADARVGLAPHSLRATRPEDLARLPELQDGHPLHIHIAEQPKEVADILAWLGARPVDWLLQNAPVGPDWCLIHATHMTDGETRAMARSGAVAGLCPITEANLGDGPFNGPTFLEEGGSFGVGSDSNVRISMTEELRQLEYSQRLRDLGRNVMLSGEGSVGTALYTAAARGGAQALGRGAGEIAVGALADLVAIDRDDPAVFALPDDQLLDGLCFAAGSRVVTDLWSAGRHQVRAGRHVARDRIVPAYRAALQSLLETT